MPTEVQPRVQGAVKRWHQRSGRGLRGELAWGPCEDIRAETGLDLAYI